jgi:hypothetical protein
MTGLRQIAHEDVQEIMGDTDGFSWPCTVTSPSGLSHDFLCRSTDIHLSIDPGTGEIVSGRHASVVLLMVELSLVGFETICGVTDNTGKPWVVEVDNIEGTPGTYRVAETHPDNALGLMVCFLEAYTA